MRRACAGAIAVALAAPDVARGQEPGPVVEHQPLRCVVAGSHPWIQARVKDAAAVRVHFRRADARDWYVVRLADEEDGWVGALPKPAPGLASFVYYVEATDAAARSGRTRELTVRVAADEGACGTDGVGPSVPEAGVATEAPPGRPALPKGFAGAEEAKAEQKVGVFDLSAPAALLIALGVGAAAVGVGLAASGTPERSNTIEFVGSSPPPGSTLSLGSLRLSLRVRVSSDTDIGPGSVVVDLRPTGATVPGCVTLWGVHPGIRAGRPAEVTVDRMLFALCTPPFTVDEALAGVRGPGETDAFGDRMVVSYSFVP